MRYDRASLAINLTFLGTGLVALLLTHTDAGPGYYWGLGGLPMTVVAQYFAWRLAAVLQADK